MWHANVCAPPGQTSAGPDYRMFFLRRTSENASNASTSPAPLWESTPAAITVARATIDPNSCVETSIGWMLQIRMSSERSAALDPFSFVIALVFITTVGATARQAIGRRDRGRGVKGDLPAAGSDSLQRMVDDLSGRVERLEEEREFYRDLLDAPGRRREISPPDSDSA